MPDSQLIKRYLKTKYIGETLFCLDRTGSTNDFLRERADVLPNGATVAADLQISGKGRRGHSWGGGKSISLSFLIKEKTAEPVAMLPILCALAVVRTLNGCYNEGFFIKWPNDIVCGGKKVCGILCESKLDREGVSAVCGIGINTLQEEEFFQELALDHAASLKMLKGRVPPQEELIAGILNTFENLVDLLHLSGTGQIISEYSRNCITLGHAVRVIRENSTIEGIAEHIHADGTLHVLTENGSIDVRAGDVSVRGRDGYI